MQARYTNMALDGKTGAIYRFGMNALKRVREAKNISQARLAELAGTTQPQINRLESDKRKLTKEWAVRLAPHLGVRPVDLLFDKDEARPLASGLVSSFDPDESPCEHLLQRGGAGVPEYDLRAGASYGGGYALNDEDGSELKKAEWIFPESWLRGEMRLNIRHTDILAIDGPSMLPDLSPGDRVLIDRSNRDPKQDAIFAVRDGDSVIVKHVQLVRNTDPPRIICRSSNPKYEPFELVLDGDNVSIIGRVAGKISKM